MVLKAIEILKWRTPIWLASGRSVAIGMEITDQVHRSHIQSSGVFRAMKVLHGIQQPIQILHQSIQPVAGSGRFGVIIGNLKLLRFSFHVQHSDNLL
jgi:hypothetical protein